MSVAQALREPEVFTQGNEDLVYEDGLAGMSNPKLVARGAKTALAAERARKLEAAAAAPLSAVGVSATAATPVAAEGAAANDDAVASMAAKTVCSGVVYHFDREERRRAGKMRIEQLRAEVGAEPLQGFEARPAFRFAKRSFDIVFSVAALVCFCWLFAIVAVLVKLDDPKGPVFFKQQRVGKNGKPFTMLKFRTMCVDAEDRLVSLMELNEKTGPVFKIAKDPRITPVGKWLRKLSLDELPQFINVLLGHIPLRILKLRPEFSVRCMGAFALPAKSSTNGGKVFSQVASCFASGLRTRRVSECNFSFIGGMEAQFLAKPVLAKVFLRHVPGCVGFSCTKSNSCLAVFS